MLGTREPEIYGSESLSDIVEALEAVAQDLGVELSSTQSNIEGELIEEVQAASQRGIDYILINPGAFTHTSIALRDAFLAVEIPFIELHLSNVYGRESFRKHSYLSDIAVGVISGFGAFSYELALRAAVEYLGR